MSAESSFSDSIIESANLFVSLPSERHVDYAWLVSDHWLNGYFNQIFAAKGEEKATEFVLFLDRLVDPDTEEHRKLIDTTADSLDKGDKASLVMEYTDDSSKMNGFARGRVYKPLIKQSYVYLPDAFGASTSVLMRAIDHIRQSLHPDQKPIVVDILKNNERDAGMLVQLGFTAVRSQVWATPELFVPYVGPEQEVIQFRR